VRAEARDQQALEDTVAGIENELDAMSRFGAVRAEAAAREIETRFRETRRQMVANFGEASEQVKKLDALIRGLSQRAKFGELSDDVSRQLGELHDLEELLAIGVEQGSIKAQDATKRRLELERELKRSLIDQIQGLAEIARRTGDPALIEAVRKLQIEWSKLGQHINQTAKGLDDALRSGLEDTLVNIVTRTKSIGEAFRDLAKTILLEIARIAAANIIDKIFGGVLNTGGGNSIGGILARILGSGTPKPSNNPQAPGSGIENIPLIIRNLSSNVGGKLTGIKSDTSGTISELRGGFGIMTKGFNELLSFLPNLLPATPSLLSTVLTAAISAVAGELGGKLAGRIGGEGGRESTHGYEVDDSGGYTRPRRVRHAEGGPITGPGTSTSDSILAPLSNGEFVVREWAARRLGAPVLNFLNSFGRLPDFFSLPDVSGFALGGAIGTLPSPNMSALGGELHLHMHGTYPTQDGQLTRASRQAIERDAARLARRGAQRGIASNK
jgi:hypothetical protein